MTLTDIFLTREEREPKHPDKVWASELGRCPFSVVLRMRGAQPDIPRHILTAMEIGSAIHSHFTWKAKWLLEREGIELQAEEEVEWENIVGRPDIVLRKDGKITVVEIKSTSKSERDLPELGHELQLAFYCKALDANTGILFYVSKRNFLKEFHYDKRKLEELAMEAARFAQLVDHLTKVPEHKWIHYASLIEGDCKWCFFRHACPLYKEQEKHI